MDDGLRAAVCALYDQTERYGWQAWQADYLVRKVVTAYLGAAAEPENIDDEVSA